MKTTEVVVKGAGLDRAEVLVGAIEGGGTKYICAVGTGPRDRILARVEFRMEDYPTPSDMLPVVVDWLRGQEGTCGKLRAIGFASFGPVDLDPRSATYGHITSTPKSKWVNTDVLAPFRRAFGSIPIGFDTDTNGAGLGEFYWGCASGLEDFVYITIGTGIGVGGMARARLLHGLVHPEVGHILLPRIPGDTFEGVCVYHGPCWEGLCSGPAIQSRAGARAEDLPADHPAWGYVTQYVGYAISNIVFTLSPRRVILGGSVRKAGRFGEDAFFRSVRQNVQSSLNGYVVSPSLIGDGIREYIVPPLLGDDAGVCGAIALGQCAFASASTTY